MKMMKKHHFQCKIIGILTEYEMLFDNMNSYNNDVYQSITNSKTCGLQQKMTIDKRICGS